MSKKIEKTLKEFIVQIERCMVSNYRGHGEHWKFCQMEKHEAQFKPSSTQDCEALIPLFTELRQLLGLDRCPTCGHRRTGEPEQPPVMEPPAPSDGEESLRSE